MLRYSIILKEEEPTHCCVRSLLKELRAGAYVGDTVVIACVGCRFGKFVCETSGAVESKPLTNSMKLNTNELAAGNELDESVH